MSNLAMSVGLFVNRLWCGFLCVLVLLRYEMMFSYWHSWNAVITETAFDKKFAFCHGALELYSWNALALLLNKHRMLFWSYFRDSCKFTEHVFHGKSEWLWKRTCRENHEFTDESVHTTSSVQKHIHTLVTCLSELQCRNTTMNTNGYRSGIIVGKKKATGKKTTTTKTKLRERNGCENDRREGTTDGWPGRAAE